MKIDSTSYDVYLTALNQTQLQTPRQQNVSSKDSEDRDSYISGLSQDTAIPSGTYDASGRMIGELPPVTNVNTDSSTNTDSSFLSQLSETFRANEDSILSTLESLGLTLDDLSDKDNLTALANAMNEGAQNLGLPTVENLEDAVDSLYNSVSGGESVSDETAAAGGSGGGSDSDEDTTTTKIVTINGVTYLETTVTEMGISTTTRTRIGGVEEEN